MIQNTRIIYLFILWSMFLYPFFLKAQPVTKPSVEKTSLWKRTNITPIPILSYNRSYGVTGGLMLSAFTDINPKDTISPPSMTTLFLGYTANKSWFGAAMQRLFLNQDKIRVVWAMGVGRSNFQFFQEIDELGNGVFIDYQTHTQFISGTFSYNVYDRFYAGLRYKYSKSVTEFDTVGKPDQIANLSGFGIPISYDTRNYIYYPSKGWNINADFASYVEWLGSDISFNALSVNANNYRKLGSKGILASRFYAYAGLGDVPFVGQKVVGGKDLRGYTEGTYRSNSITALQTEYRQPFQKKWGFVGFGGLAYAFASNGVKASGLLPSVGAGLRYLVIPKRKMNAGVDFAVGKGDWGIYFRVGESF